MCACWQSAGSPVTAHSHLPKTRAAANKAHYEINKYTTAKTTTRLQANSLPQLPRVVAEVRWFFFSKVYSARYSVCLCSCGSAHLYNLLGIVSLFSCVLQTHPSLCLLISLLSLCFSLFPCTYLSLCPSPVCSGVWASLSEGWREMAWKSLPCSCRLGWEDSREDGTVCSISEIQILILERKIAQQGPIVWLLCLCWRLGYSSSCSIDRFSIQKTSNTNRTFTCLSYTIVCRIYFTVKCATMIEQYISHIPKYQ